MNKRIAIKIMRTQLAKVESSEKFSEIANTWQLQTTTYVCNFFGENSSEYEWINHAELRGEYKADPIPFLNNCIETINNIGLYKRPKSNFLTSAPNWLIMLLFPFIFSAGIAIGKYSSDLQNIELRRELKSCLNSLSNPSDKISDEIKYPDKKSIQ
ncbi:MAG: hypothetical protein GQ564_11680 [Bacteroidales bacterium]|nr:hypothetical protein [Bacteroidales bacterium]